MGTSAGRCMAVRIFVAMASLLITESSRSGVQKSADRDHSDRMIMITGIGDVIT